MQIACSDHLGYAYVEYPLKRGLPDTICRVSVVYSITMSSEFSPHSSGFGQQAAVIHSHGSPPRAGEEAKFQYPSLAIDTWFTRKVTIAP